MVFRTFPFWLTFLAGGGNSSKNRRVSKSATTSVPEKSEDKHLEDTSASGDNIEDTGDIKRTNNKQRRSSSGGAQNGTKTRSKISSAESRENISGDEAADEVYPGLYMIIHTITIGVL